MKPTKWIWTDGRFVPWAKATTHVLTHSLHYGTGVFDSMRFYKTARGPTIFRLKDHVHRFFYSAKVIGMKMPFSENQIQKAILELVKKNGLQEGYIRPLAFYGYGNMRLGPRENPVNIAIACWGWGAYLGKALLKIKTTSFRRISPQSFVCDAKVSGYYANSILAINEIQKRGFDEALFLDNEDHVAEGAGENIFMVKKGVIFTPSLGAILPGITRDSVIRIARDAGYRVIEKNLKLADFYKADECFFTGTAAEITPIGWIDGKRVSRKETGSVTAKIKTIFSSIIHGTNARYKNWLTVC